MCDCVRVHLWHDRTNQAVFTWQDSARETRQKELRKSTDDVKGQGAKGDQTSISTIGGAQAPRSCEKSLGTT